MREENASLSTRSATRAVHIVLVSIAAFIVLIASVASAGTLDTPDNLAQEALLLRLLASEPMREAAKRTEATYRADAQSRTEGGAASLRRAVDAIAAAAVQYAISEDGALHAEKYFHTVSEEFGNWRPAFRWRQLTALARVTASEHGYPAPGYADACKLLKLS